MTAVSPSENSKVSQTRLSLQSDLKIISQEFCNDAAQGKQKPRDQAPDQTIPAFNPVI